MSGLLLFPWDRGEAPFWVNPENGLMWYHDKDSTEWCSRPIHDLPPLEAAVFFVCRKEGDRIEPITRILIDTRTNEPLAEHTSLEAMGVKIDALRLARGTNRTKKSKRRSTT